MKAVRTLVLALLALAPVASAGALPIRFERPANGTVLAGGSTAVVRWSAAGELDPRVEEWEAFLSVDGGKYYGARITPHLDLSIREFRFVVPNVASRDARILLRFGDERYEQQVELPISLTIEPTARFDATAIVSSTTTESGESARPGDAAVAEWAEGDRLVETRLPSIDATATLTESKPRFAAAPGIATITRQANAGVTIAQRHHRAVCVTQDAHEDILLQSHRLNI